MAWYYVLDGASHGPVAEADMRSLRAQNTIALDTPVWTDGMAEWVPFSNSPLSAGGVPVALASIPAGATHTCVQCGQLFPEGEMLNYEGSWVCAACKPAFFQRIKEGVAAPGTLVYASVGSRFLALFLDGLIIFGIILVPSIILGVIMGATQNIAGGPTAVSGGISILLGLILYILPPIYEIFMIGKYGATWGKMAMKIKVVRPDGGRLSYGRSTGRYFAKILSALILYIGFLMAIWDKEKRALHDQICQTRVIRVEPS
jgi:uncharacterized RDD family membrane protein YckC